MLSASQRAGRPLCAAAIVAIGAWIAVARGVVEPGQLGPGGLPPAFLPVMLVVGGLGMLAGGRRIVPAGALLVLGVGASFVGRSIVDAGGTATLQWSLFLCASGTMVVLLSAYVLGLLGALGRTDRTESSRIDAPVLRASLDCQRRRHRARPQRRARRAA